MNKIINMARAAGLFQLIIFYFGYFFTLNIDFLLFFIGQFVNHKINNILKYKIFLPIFGKNDIPLLGKGVRPNGAKNCCWFAPCNPKYPKYPNSYGMPSGHSQSIAFFSTLGALYLLTNKKYKNNKNMKLIIIIGSIIFLFSMVFVMYTRVLFKCHTIGQTIIGSSIGICLAYLLFKYKNIIKKKLKTYKINELVIFTISTFILVYTLLK